MPMAEARYLLALSLPSRALMSLGSRVPIYTYEMPPEILCKPCPKPKPYIHSQRRVAKYLFYGRGTVPIFSSHIFAFKPTLVMIA